MRAAVAATLVLTLLLPSLSAAQPLAPGPPQDEIVLPAAIPLFPLPDIGLFPNISQPFNIFEPRYREMIADALEGDRIIGMVMLRPGFEADYDGRPPVYGIGCAGTIVDHELLPDGRYAIVLRGLVKFRIVSEDQSRPYRLAAVEPLPETIDDEMRLKLKAQRDRVVTVLLEVAPNAQAPPPAVADEDVINTLAQLLPMEPADRQVLLEKDGPFERSETLLDLLELMR